MRFVPRERCHRHVVDRLAQFSPGARVGLDEFLDSLDRGRPRSSVRRDFGWDFPGPLAVLRGRRGRFRAPDVQRRLGWAIMPERRPLGLLREHRSSRGDHRQQEHSHGQDDCSLKKVSHGEVLRVLEFNLRERPPIADVRERPLTIARIAPVKSTVNGLVLRRLLSRLGARVTEPLPSRHASDGPACHTTGPGGLRSANNGAPCGLGIGSVVECESVARRQTTTMR